ncbi:MAG: alpha/beta hydrolase [Bacteroidales bacterium]|nr:alpha/beta hydrolase [Bacteroidales bacterium]
MKSLICYIISILLIIPIIKVDAQETEFDFSTVTYLKNDSASLELDFFRPGDSAVRSPLVIFVHGGGFSNGERSHGHPFCQILSDSGVSAASITYTLYMKGKNFSCEGMQSEKIKAIQLAAYQSRIATQWFISHYDSFNIDTNRIFLAGSSAGAEAVLQAAYWDTSAANFFPDTLSGTFRYAGVISGAGAILDLNMINKSTVMPTLCYHGTCDPLVPYHMAPHHYCDPTASGYMMFFGSLAIHEKITALNGNSQLMSYCGDGHKHAGTPFYGEETFTVLQFINRTLKGESFNIHRVFKNGEKCDLPQTYSFCD